MHPLRYASLALLQPGPEALLELSLFEARANGPFSLQLNQGDSMKITIDYYKESGKWYSDVEMELPIENGRDFTFLRDSFARGEYPGLTSSLGFSMWFAVVTPEDDSWPPRHFTLRG